MRTLLAGPQWQSLDSSTRPAYMDKVRSEEGHSPVVIQPVSAKDTCQVQSEEIRLREGRRAFARSHSKLLMDQ